MNWLTGKNFILRIFLFLSLMLLYSDTYVLCSSPPFRGAWGQNPQTPHGGLATAQFFSEFHEGSLISSPDNTYLNNPPLGGAGGVKRSGACGGDREIYPPSPPEGGLNPIKIGLLIQTATSLEASRGALIAINKVNSKGGFNGSEFELVVKSMEGPWGTGSKQAVDMIFQEEVVAILGSHDGRNAHLVEQATTKSHVAFLSAWAGDATLAQAFTPWFFNCVPGDELQASLLLRLIQKKKYYTPLLITDNDYDAKSGYRSFLKIAKKKGIQAPLAIEINNQNPDINSVCERIISRKADCLILYTDPFNAEKIILKLSEMRESVVLFGPLSLLREGSPVYKYNEILDNILLLSDGDWFREENSEFAKEYKRNFGSFPGAAAAYAFDGMTALINAIITAEGNRENVQKTLLETKTQGVTGSFGFDSMGNRVNHPR